MEQKIEQNSGPLAGLKVLDLTRVLSGPYAGKWLALMGADVLKIENPKDPDITRNYEPLINGRSAYYPAFNHNKRSITLNLKEEKAKEIFRDLAKDADVVLENFRPGVMDRLGIGYDAVSKLNPGIIYASISGYGTTGPYSQLPGYDVCAQAVSGIMYLTGAEDGPPTRIGSSYGDTVSGVTAVVAILAALYCRSITGQGQQVETSLVDSLISLSTSDYIRYFTQGYVPHRVGNMYKWWTPYGTYKAKDGYYIIGGANDHFFALLCKAMGQSELASDPRFVHNKDRVEHRKELDDIIDAWAGNMCVEDVCRILTENGVPTARVNSIVELANDAHIAGARNMFPSFEQTGIGEMKVTNIPVRFSKSGLVPLSEATELGENNEEVYSALGYSREELEELREKGII